jgi:hypothetical protein
MLQVYAIIFILLGLNPGRLPLSVNVSVDRLDNPYQG